jgi:metal-responsive CopG/Arc/MetJ family transcriptional regulator
MNRIDVNYRGIQMIAVSLPDELLQKLDNAVAKTGKNALI